MCADKQTSLPTPVLSLFPKKKNQLPNSIRILANPKAPQKIVQVSTLASFKTCRNGIKKPWHSQTFECMEVPKLL
jgi:hypothetical protein